MKAHATCNSALLKFYFEENYPENAATDDYCVEIFFFNEISTGIAAILSYTIQWKQVQSSISKIENDYFKKKCRKNTATDD